MMSPPDIPCRSNSLKHQTDYQHKKRDKTAPKQNRKVGVIHGLLPFRLW